MSSVQRLIRKFKDMPYNSRQGLVILGIVIVLVSIPVTISLIRQNPQFTSKAATATLPITFSGTPTSPQSIYTHPDYAKLDVQIHQRDQQASADRSFQEMDADHGTDCSASANNLLFPTHVVTTYEQAVFVCKDHVMTAMHGDGYGEIVLTPSQMCDLSQTGQCVITWDMSTHPSSDRDWVTVNIASLEDQLSLYSAGPDIQPDQFVPGHILELSSRDFLTGFWAQNNNEDRIPGCPYHPDDANGPVHCGWLADSKAVRDQFKITLRQHDFDFCKMTGEPDGQPICFFMNQPHELTASKLVVQFGHHNYTSEKGHGLDGCKPLSEGGPECPPNTWHWDNFNLSPSVPFTIIHCGPRVTTGGTVTCDAPAPANSFLRFAALGKVTVNGQPVSPKVPTNHPETQNNYFVPIAAGTKSFTFAFDTDDWYNGPFLAQDIAIWSTDTGGGGGTTCTKQGDLNCDGLVNILDMSILLSKWNTNDATADINQDGKVSVFDLSILLSKWGS